MTENKSFTSRWSERKQAVKSEAEQEEIVVEESLPSEEPEKTDAEILAELNLKDPDDMEAGDDFSAFMDSAVPHRIKSRALRKLWLSNPALANLDNLLDYGEDFTNAGAVVENIATAYKVGKGFVDRLVEEDEEKAESKPETTGEKSEADAETAKIENSAPIKSVRKPGEIRVQAPLPSESELTVTSEISTKQPESRRKRMNFEF